MGWKGLRVDRLAQLLCWLIVSPRAQLSDTAIMKVAVHGPPHEFLVRMRVTHR